MTTQVSNNMLTFDGGAFSYRNLLINGAFRTNALGYVSGAAVGVGVPGAATGYGHDGWRGGAGGGSYTYSQSLGPTTITLASGTLISKCDPADVVGGAYVLSWAGSAQARVGINNAAPSGSYAASPITIAAATAGQSISIEFNTGTLGLVQLELGATPTPFEWLPLPLQTARCAAQIQVYGNAVNSFLGGGYQAATTALYIQTLFPVPMRAVPTLVKNGTWSVGNCSQPSAFAVNAYGFILQTTVTALGAASYIANAAGQNLTFTATL